MRVLVTGGTGLLGWWVVKAFVSKGFDVYATYHLQSPKGLEDANWVRLDLDDPLGAGNAVRKLRPDVVVHSAAYTDVDGCEVRRNYSYRVNYLATRALAKASLEVGSFFIYISTDYVFDGERGMYREGDTPYPPNFYGLTKLLGEAGVLSLLEDSSAIVRVSGLYGYSPTGKRNFGIRALESLAEGREVRAFVDQYLSPTYVPALAERILKVYEKQVTGIVHIAGERLSRYEFALTIAEVLGVDRALVKPVKMSSVKLLARRPKDSSLDVSKAVREGLALPPTRDCVREFVSLYKNKNKTTDS